MGSVIKRLRPSSGERVDQQASAEQESAEPMQAERATPPAETDEPGGGSEGPQTPPQQDGSE